MTTHRQIRAEIVKRVRLLGNTDKFYEHERFADRIETLRDLYAHEDDSGSRIKGGFIIRPTAHDDDVGTCPAWMDSWQLRLYMAWSDANQSELEFDDWIDAIRDEFKRGTELLSDNNLSISSDGRDGGVTLIENQPVKFAGVLCHSAALQMTTMRYNHDR